MGNGQILVAGVGNIFFGDDGFGVEVARQLQRRSLPDKVRVVDYGIRSYDLAYAIMEEPEAVILVDAAPCGEAPGTVLLIEPNLSELENALAGDIVNAHSLNPLRVLQMVNTLGGRIPCLYLIACEPAILETADGYIGLSEKVQAAVPTAIQMIRSLIDNILKSCTSLP